MNYEEWLWRYLKSLISYLPDPELHHHNTHGASPLLSHTHDRTNDPVVSQKTRVVFAWAVPEV